MQVEERCPLSWALILPPGLGGSTEPYRPGCLLFKDGGSQVLEKQFWVAGLQHQGQGKDL